MKQLINNDLKFEEDGHIYTYKGKQLTSITTILKEYFPFDSDKIINMLIKSKTGKYSGMTKEKILSLWEEKAQRGTDLHQYCEDWINGDKREPSNPLEDSAYNFLKKFNPDKVYSELRVFSEKLGIAGSIDLLFKVDNEWFIGDFKTDKTINKKNYKGDKCLFPIQILDNCNWNKYSLQLSLYRLLLEKEYGLKVKSCKGIHIKPLTPRTRGEGFTEHLMYDLKSLAQTLLGHWRSKKVE